ncbi:hypothetical protein [Burkholderia ubonensis]|uniref:hypothetical protein n=1 Tax=Burkholderia ubonensis TaxID=101571 RepID=UPI0012F92AAF|nr:hypothetical protein [Burkholderia ubonensis]
MKLAHRYSPRCGNDENRLALAAHAAKADISNVVSPVGKIKMTTAPLARRLVVLLKKAPAAARHAARCSVETPQRVASHRASPEHRLFPLSLQ